MACTHQATRREVFYKDCQLPLERKGEACTQRIPIFLPVVVVVVEAAVPAALEVQGPTRTAVPKYRRVLGLLAIIEGLAWVSAPPVPQGLRDIAATGISHSHCCQSEASWY